MADFCANGLHIMQTITCTLNYTQSVCNLIREKLPCPFACILQLAMDMNLTKASGNVNIKKESKKSPHFNLRNSASFVFLV